MTKTIIGGVLLTIATLFIQRIYFTDKPEVVYSLSNEIYTSLLESEDREIIQQLTIKNIGTQVANRIVITINENVRGYDLKKYSEIDSTNVVSTKAKFELIYPSLPPDGHIEVLIKSINKGISKNNLVVRHNSGLGAEVFQKSNSTAFLILILFFLFWIVVIIWSGIGIYENSFQSRIRYDPIDKILKKIKANTYIIFPME